MNSLTNKLLTWGPPALQGNMPTSCASGICDGLLLSFQMVHVGPGLWEGQRHGPYVRPSVKTHDRDIFVLDGGGVGCCGEQEVRTPPALRAAQRCCSSLASGQLRRSCSPMQQWDGGGCQHWGTGGVKERRVCSLSDLSKSVCVIILPKDMINSQ